MNYQANRYQQQGCGIVYMSEAKANPDTAKCHQFHSSLILRSVCCSYTFIYLITKADERIKTNSFVSIPNGALLYQPDIINRRLMKISNIFSRRNRILLRELVITDFKLRYQGSVLGYAWSLLKPLFLFAIMYVVFGLLIKLGSIEHYAVYLLFGIVLWTFFGEATSQGMMSIVNRGDLLRKINFPKYIIVLSTTISALINLTLNFIIVAVLMIVNGVDLHVSAFMLPVYIIELYLLALGLAFFLSALNVKYRDTSHIWEIIMQAAFYATPIIYPLSLVIEKSQVAAQFLLLNPIAQAIQDARYSLITHETVTAAGIFSNQLFVAIPFLIVVAIFVSGTLYFRHTSKYFAERI